MTQPLVPATRPVPTDHPHAAAMWLLDRHPDLLALTSRLPGAMDPSGLVDLDVIAAVVLEHDAESAAWSAYSPPREDEDDLPRPARTPGAQALGRMTRTEQTQLRLLAVFTGTPIPIRAIDFTGLGMSGQAYLADWCAAIQAS